jgi:hypothetical protein
VLEATVSFFVANLCHDGRVPFTRYPTRELADRVPYSVLPPRVAAPWLAPAVVQEKYHARVSSTQENTPTHNQHVIPAHHTSRAQAHRNLFHDSSVALWSWRR